MFHSEAGIINYGLTSLGLIDQPIPWLSSPDLALHAAILADVWKTTPFMTLLLFAGLQRIPDNLLRAARVDATPPLRMFRKIILPALNPVLVTAVILRMLDAFRVFDVIYVMTGGGPANTTETLSIYAYRTFFQGLQFGYGSSVVIVQVLVMVALTLLIRGLLERRRARA
ncbi:MAG: sugar ABC transporter permease [Nitrospinaceae bacterium]|nr:sugar ABC transporter permease [Nitrospinaceae bacterium]